MKHPILRRLMAALAAMVAAELAQREGAEEA